MAEAASKINKSKEIITDIDLGTVQCTTTPDSDWTSEFERQQRKIIELWVLCSVPLIHRTYFFLLFKGDPSDSVYMEVELRRLSFLKGTFSHGSDESRYVHFELINNMNKTRYRLHILCSTTVASKIKVLGNIYPLDRKYITITQSILAQAILLLL